MHFFQNDWGRNLGWWEEMWVLILPLIFLNTEFCNLRPNFTNQEGVERKNEIKFKNSFQVAYKHIRYIKYVVQVVWWSWRPARQLWDICCLGKLAAWQSGVCSSLWKGASCPGLRFSRWTKSLVGASWWTVHHSYPPHLENLKDKEVLLGKKPGGCCWVMCVDQVSPSPTGLSMTTSVTTSTSLQLNHIFHSVSMCNFYTLAVLLTLFMLHTLNTVRRDIWKVVCSNVSNKYFL